MKNIMIDKIKLPGAEVVSWIVLQRDACLFTRCFAEVSVIP
jgi:hypothetical protein